MTNNSTNIIRMVEKLYSNRHKSGDVTFLVESQRIRAHRIVLAALSPKYDAQFYGPNPDEGEIRVPCVSAAAFEVFLQFFYKKTVDLTMDNIEMVLDLAKQSLVDEFFETCANFLKDQIKANKLCVPYRLANLYDIESLRLACEQRISTNTKDIFASDDFLRYDRDMLLQILKMDTLNCREKDVFIACNAWARARCKQTHLDDGKPENLRTALGDAIYQIRFSSINAEEFADLHKSMEGFFTANESYELFYITAKLKDFKSQKFNPNPRTLQNEPKELPRMFGPVAWSLELDRFIRMKRTLWEIDAVGLFNFSFGCNNPIRLHGIGIGIHFSEAELKNFSKTLSVHAATDDWDDGWDKQFAPMKCNVYKSPTRNNETMIIFEKPIERVTKFECTIEIPSKRLNYEFDLHCSIRAENIVFTFHRDGEWMKRLFFDKYDA